MATGFALETAWARRRNKRQGYYRQLIKADADGTAATIWETWYFGATLSGINAAASITEQADSLVSAATIATVEILGAASLTEEADTVSATSSLVIAAVLGGIEANDTIEAMATMPNPYIWTTIAPYLGTWGEVSPDSGTWTPSLATAGTWANSTPATGTWANNAPAQGNWS